MYQETDAFYLLLNTDSFHPILGRELAYTSNGMTVKEH